VQPRFERYVAQQLWRQGIQTFVPMTRIQRGDSAIKVPLFSGYLFCGVSSHRSLPTFLEPGTLEVLDCDEQVIARDIENLKRLENSGLLYSPSPYLEGESTAIAAEGPLVGMEGFMLADDRFVIPVRSFLRSVVVTAGPTCRFVSLDPSCKADPAA